MRECHPGSQKSECVSGPARQCGTEWVTGSQTQGGRRSEPASAREDKLHKIASAVTRMLF